MAGTRDRTTRLLRRNCMTSFTLNSFASASVRTARGLCTASRGAKMVEDAADDAGLGDEGDDPHHALAAGTDERIEGIGSSSSPRLSVGLLRGVSRSRCGGFRGGWVGRRGRTGVRPWRRGAELVSAQTGSVVGGQWSDPRPCERQSSEAEGWASPGPSSVGGHRGDFLWHRRTVSSLQCGRRNRTAPRSASRRTSATSPVDPSAGPIPAMFREYVVVPVYLLMSAAVTSKLDLPAAVGVPASRPFASSASPEGTLPRLAEYLYGPLPPLAASV